MKTKIYTLIFDNDNGVYTQSFTTKDKALDYLKDWDCTMDEEEVSEMLKELSENNLFEQDDSSIRLEESTLI